MKRIAAFGLILISSAFSTTAFSSDSCTRLEGSLSFSNSPIYDNVVLSAGDSLTWPNVYSTTELSVDLIQTIVSGGPVQVSQLNGDVFFRIVTQPLELVVNYQFVNSGTTDPVEIEPQLLFQDIDNRSITNYEQLSFNKNKVVSYSLSSDSVISAKIEDQQLIFSSSESLNPHTPDNSVVVSFAPLESFEATYYVSEDRPLSWFFLNGEVTDCDGYDVVEWLPPAPIIEYPLNKTSTLSESITVSGTGFELTELNLVSSKDGHLCDTRADLLGAWQCDVNLSPGSHVLTARVQTQSGLISNWSLPVLILVSDQDGNGIIDSAECDGVIPCPDTDGDGIVDSLDPDNDNDGYPDEEDYGETGNDSDGDLIDDAWDVDETGGEDQNQDGFDDNLIDLLDPDIVTPGPSAPDNGADDPQLQVSVSSTGAFYFGLLLPLVLLLSCRKPS